MWLWDLSLTLGWARGPDRSGLWHWLEEQGPGEPYQHVPYDMPYTETPHNAPPGDASGAFEDLGVGAAGGPGGFNGAELSSGQHAHRLRVRQQWMTGAPVFVGAVPCFGTLPVCCLAPGSPSLVLNLGGSPGGREYLTASCVVAGAEAASTWGRT